MPTMRIPHSQPDPAIFDMHEFLARPRFITRSVFSPSNTYGHAIYTGSIMRTLLNLPQVANKLSNVQGIRARLHIRIETSGTPYVFGRILANWLHTGGENALFENVSEIPIVSMTQRSCLYHTMIDPSSRDSVEMSLPFVHLSGLHMLRTDANYDSFGLHVLNPLKYNGPSVATNPTIVVLAWMTDVELLIPHLQSELTGGMSRAAPGSGVSIRGFASSFARGLADAALTAVGLGAPQLPDLPSTSSGTHILRTHSDQPQRSVSLSGHRVVENPITPMDPESDPMDFQSIARRECWISRIAWADGSSPGMLAAFAVAPGRQCDYGTHTPFGGTAQEFICLTPAGAIATCFRYWRGMAKFRIEVICNKFCRGKLRVRYMPYTTLSALTYVDEVGDIPAKIIDISDSTEVEMEIPWCLPIPWAKVHVNTDSQYSTVSANGFLVIDAYSGLESSGAGGVEINVFSSFPGLEVAVPAQIFGGDDIRIGVGSFAELQSGQAIDQYYNVRDLIKIQEPYFGATSGANEGEVQIYSIFAKPHYKSKLGSTSGMNLNLTGGITAQTRFSFLSSCFLAYTGSIRITVCELLSKPGTTTNPSWVNFARVVRMTQRSTTAYDRMLFSNYTKEIVNADYAVSSLVSVESSPSGAGGTFITTIDCPNTEINDFNITKFPVANANKYPAIDFILPTSQTSFIFTQAAGDDYALHHFQFVPAIFFG